MQYARTIGKQLKIFLLSVSYILHYVYPGDYGSYIDLDHDWEYCVPCAEGHLTGKPQWQWRDSPIAKHKRDDNIAEDNLTDFVNNGIRDPTSIELAKHKVLTNGHHRFYAALDLEWKYIPVLLLNTEGIVDFNQSGISNRFVQPWNGLPYTESSQIKALAY